MTFDALKILFLIFLSYHSYAGQDKIVVYLDELPPYIITGSKNEGLGIKIAEGVFKDANVELVLKNEPLLRALRAVQETANTCILPLERNQERETQFEWISPFLLTHSSLFSSKSNPIKLSVLKDAQDLPLPIGVANGSAAHKYLEGAGFKVDPVNSDEQNLGKLVDRKRLSLWATDTLQGQFLAKKAGKEIVESLQYFTTIRALACNLKTSKDIIHRLRTSITKFYADGTIGKLTQEFNKENKL